jgi:membrane fusion protein
LHRFEAFQGKCRHWETDIVDRVLFRPEALAFHDQERQWGNVARLQSVSSKVFAWFVIMSVGAVGVFLAVGQYSRKETAVGYLTPSTGTAKIFAPERGTIGQVHVAEGDQVREGQPLITVETDQIAANGVDINSSMLDTLAAQKALLTKNIAAEEQRTGSEHERLNAQARASQAEIIQLQSQAAIQTQQLRAAELDLKAGEYLRAKGYMTDLEERRRQMQVLAQRQALSALNQQIVTRQNDRTQTLFALQQLPTVMAQKIQAMRDDLATIQQRIQEVNGRRAYVIRAPTSGRVSTLQATVGQNADPQRLQLEIIPDNGTLQADLFLPARAIGFVHAGQAVRILYDAFPYQHFGTYRAHIVSVSRTILTGSDVAGPITLQEPAYRLIAALDRPDIDADGKTILLQPDMLLKADIILEKRSLMSWLFGPLLGIRT